jgi:ketosteroid isomerase-like protein
MLSDNLYHAGAARRAVAPQPLDEGDMAHSDNRRGTTLDFNMRGSMWAMHEAVARLPRSQPATVEARLRLIEEEQAARDLLVRYTYFYDAGDLEGVMSVFHDDGVLINPRGTYAGKDAIRRNYAFLISLSKIVFHLAPNVLVRVADDYEQAWMTAYYYGIAVAPDGKLIATAGTYADRLAKTGSGWQIIARRITYNFRNSLTPQPPTDMPAAPTPSRAESSRDLVGPGVEM